MNKKPVVTPLSIALISSLVSCNAHQEIRDKTIDFFNNVPKPSENLITYEESEVFKRGESISYLGGLPYLSYPLKNRDVSEIRELTERFFPEFIYATDIKTNQLFARSNCEETLSILELADFLKYSDISPAQFRASVYSLRVSASNLWMVENNLDLKFKGDNIDLGLKANIQEGQQNNFVSHTLSGIIGSGIPQATLSATLSGLQEDQYISDLSKNVIVAETGAGTYSIRAPVRFPVTNQQISNGVTTNLQNFIDTERELELSVTGMAEGQIYLTFRAKEGEIVPTNNSSLPKVIQRGVDLPRFRMKIGQVYMVTTRIDTAKNGTSTSSPILGDIVGGIETGRSNTYVVYLILPEKLDISKDSGNSLEDLIKN